MKFNWGTLVTGCLGGLLAFGVAHYFKGAEEPKAFLIEKKVSETQPYQFTAETGSSAMAAVDFTLAAEKTVNAVVHIKTAISVSNTHSRDPFYEYFFGPLPQNSETYTATGSGVIISSEGHIVTNNHVIAHADKITVTLNNNKSYEAKLVGKDEGTDIALLKINASQLPAVTMGNSDDVKIGEWVLAVGNPFNLTSTVTAGIVSAKSRNINILSGNPGNNIFPIESFIQTDAAVNPGNSGGALVNTRGELIGINTAIASNTGSYSGYSFAVPVNLVQKVTSDLIEFGAVQRGFLGVNIRNIDQSLADEIGISELKGVYVGGTVSGGAAEEAGIKQGDIIRYIENTEVNSSSELQEYVGRFRPGDEIKVRLIRDKKEMLVPVKLRNYKGTTAVVKNEKPEGSTVYGATFSEVSEEEKNQLGIACGVKIVSIGRGKLATAGIGKDFIILKVDKKEAISAEAVATYLKNKKGTVTIEGVYPGGTRAYYTFGL